MTMNPTDVLIWLREFKYTWFPQTISADLHLQKLLVEKLCELEQLFTLNDVFPSEEYSFTQSNGTDRVVLSNQQALLTPPDLTNHAQEEVNAPEKYSKPAIRIKRIPLAEAETYLRASWSDDEPEKRSDLKVEQILDVAPVKSKRGRKPGTKNRKTTDLTRRKYERKIPAKKPILSPPSTETSTASDISPRFTRSKKSISPLSTASSLPPNAPQTNRNATKKNKRKLRATAGEDDDLSTLGNLSQTEQVNGDAHCDQIPRYIGQNGILSQTRKTNETMPNMIDLDDFPITLKSRLTNPVANNTARFGEDLTLLSDPVAMIDDVVIVPNEDEQMFHDMIENQDNESIFASLDLTHERPLEGQIVSNNNSILNYDDCIEDISNDGIDPPPSSSSPAVASVSLTS